MTPQELKNSILQLAIQGKLVEQRHEEGTGEELFRQMQAEKQRLIKAGTIKREKPLPEITDGEKPFEIPENWIWTRLRAIVYNRGQEVPSSRFSYIDIGSIDNKNQRLSSEENIIEASKAPSRARKIVEMGDILYSTVRPYLHNMCIVDRQFSCKPIASTGFAAMTCISGIYNKFLFYYLLSPAFDSYANHTDNSKGVAYPAINDDRLYQAIIPLPPLAEQKRIVARIEELLPYIDRYEKAWRELEDFNKRFPVDMQKAILQFAIQGKLVEQRPEEGTGEELYRQIQAEKQRLIKAGTIKREKPLPEIADDEKPFEIPESWVWVRFGDIANKFTDGTHNTPKYQTTGIPFISVKDMSSGKLDFSNTKYISAVEHDELFKRCNPEFGDLLISKIGTTGVPAIVNTEMPFSLFVSVALMKFSQNLLIVNYLYYLVLSPLVENQARENTRGVGNKNWVLDKIRNSLIPLPPLAEQKRIVAKLEEILPLCEKLK